MVHHISLIFHPARYQYRYWYIGSSISLFPFELTEWGDSADSIGLTASGILTASNPVS